MSWRKQVKSDHDYHDQIKHIVQETMRHHEVSDDKLEAILTDLLEEMNRITLKMMDDHDSARDYIYKRWY